MGLMWAYPILELRCGWRMIREQTQSAHETFDSRESTMTPCLILGLCLLYLLEAATTGP